tara:strand:+ start:4599 stop:5492 length:894 start_codon:yes stop_codon:yes gene_type:complete
MRFNIRRSNYSRAGKAAADEVVNIYAAARRNSPDYGKMVQQAADIRSAVKRAGVSAAADVSVAGINAAAKVEGDKIVGKAKRGLKKEQRKAGALGVAGSMFNQAGTLLGEKRDRREIGSEDGFFDLMIEKEKTRQQEFEAMIQSNNTQTSNTDTSSSEKSGDTSSSSVSTGVSSQGGAEPYQMSKDEVRKLALDAGFDPKNANIVVGVAGGESSRDPTNNTKRSGLYAKEGEDSVGLMQINWGYHKDKGWLQKLGITSREQLFDPATNMKAAKYLFDQYGDFRDWTVYNEGIYKGHL